MHDKTVNRGGYMTVNPKETMQNTTGNYQRQES